MNSRIRLLLASAMIGIVGVSAVVVLASPGTGISTVFSKLLGVVLAEAPETARLSSRSNSRGETAHANNEEKFLRSKRPIPGRYIVVLDDEASGGRGGSSRARAMANELGAAHDALVDRVYEYALNGFAAEMTEARAIALSRDPRVKYVEEDSIGAASDVQPNATWGLDRIDQRNQPLDTLYNYNMTGTGVRVYVLDSGIRTTHADFGGRASIGFDAIGGTGSDTDCNGHGTHVAGTVGGTTWGVAKNVSLVSVRVLGCSGFGSASSFIAGVDWVTANAIKPAIANMSLGTVETASVDTAVNNSINSGITYVAAAGNETQNACNISPARVGAAITVSASDIADQKAGFANYGVCVDLFAPGANITSAGHTSDTDTRVEQGTSMAAPHVAGAAALYLQANPGATPAQVRSFLYSESTKGIIGQSNSPTNHLLYTNWASTPILPPNNAPTASFVHNCVGTECTFDASASTDSDGTVAAYAWDFGDGEIGYGANIVHTYSSFSTFFAVTLRVLDDDGDVSTPRVVNGNTLIGTNITINEQFGYAKVTFPQVTATGNTRLDPFNTQFIPSYGNTLCGICPLAYSITTNAVFTNPVTVSLDVPAGIDDATFNSMSLLVYPYPNFDVPPIDITTGRLTNPDGTREIVGQSTGLGTYALATQSVAPTPSPTPTPTPTPSPTPTPTPTPNTPPVFGLVSVTSPIDEGSSTTLAGSFSDPDVGDTFTLTVDWGDGSTPDEFSYPAGTTSFSETHVYADDGEYNISRTLEDNAGGSASGGSFVLVDNVPPVLTDPLISPSSITAGSSAAFTASVSDVGILDAITVVVNWGDNTPFTIVNVPAGGGLVDTSHQYNSIGTFSVIVTTSDDADFITTNLSVTVTAATPTPTPTPTPTASPTPSPTPNPTATPMPPRVPDAPFTEIGLNGSAYAGLTPGPDGRLYGVTYDGPVSDNEGDDEKLDAGTIYSVDRDLTNRIDHYIFLTETDGNTPYNELTWVPATGKFYGATSSGGAEGSGKIFTFDPATKAFAAMPGGFTGEVWGALVLANGYLYGTVQSFPEECVFRLRPTDFAVTFLQCVPWGSSLQGVTFGDDGWLYGNALFGGINCDPQRPGLGCGEIFKIRPWNDGEPFDPQYQVIFQFQFYGGFNYPCPPGDKFCVRFPVTQNYPVQKLDYGSDGYLYGSTFYSVFRLNPNAANVTDSFRTLWNDGGGIQATVIEGLDGRLYFTDYGGGSDGVGRIASMNRDGSGVFELRNFNRTLGSTATGPWGRLFHDPVTNRVYGTTEYTNASDPFPGTAFFIGVPPTEYRLSGSPDGIDPVAVDDALDIFVNDALLYTDGIAPSGNRGPIPIPEGYFMPGDIVRFEVRDVYGDCRHLSPIYLVDNFGNSTLMTNGFPITCGWPAGNNGVVFIDTSTVPGIVNTPTGTNVVVQSANVSLTFASVTTAGTTTITPIDPATITEPVPSGYTIASDALAFEITTTAVYTGNITVCLTVSNVNDEAVFNTLALLHSEGGILVDVTTSRDFATRSVCGIVTSLSPFVIGRPNVPTPTPTITPTPEPTPTVTPTPEPTPTVTPTPEPTPTVTPTPEPTPTVTPTPEPTPTVTPTPEPTPTVTPTPEPTPTVTPTPEPSPTVTPTPTPEPLVSQITSSMTSCSQFAAGTAATVSSAQYTVKARTGAISSVTPSGIIYWLRVLAVAGSNHINIEQSITTGNFSGVWGLAKGSNVFNENCVDRLKPAFAEIPGTGTTTFTVDWNAPAAGNYVIMLKLDSREIKNQPAPDPASVHFDFSSADVPDSTAGIDLIAQSALLAELYPFALDYQPMLPVFEIQAHRSVF